MTRRTEDRPRRAARLRRVGLILCIVVLAALGGWEWVVPRLIEGRVRSALAVAGAPEARFEVKAVSLTGLEIEGLEIGDLAKGTDAALRAGRVLVSYSPTGLISGRVESLRIVGAVYDRTQPWPLPPHAGARPEQGPAGPLPTLPFDRVEIDGARVVAGKDATQRVRVDLVLQTGASGWRATARAAGFDLALTADLDLARSGEQAAGPLTLRVGDGTTPDLVLDGRARIAATPTGRNLALQLGSEGPAFELATAGLTVAGAGEAIALRGEFPGASGSLGRAVLALAGLDLAAGAWRVQGLAGELRFASLVPLLSEGVDELAWRTLVLGRAEAGAGRARFRVAAGPDLVVEHVDCALARGTLAIDGFRFGRDTETIDTRIQVEGASLDDWLRLVSGGRITGTGSLAGELQVHLDLGTGVDLDLPRGHLRAVGGGILRVLDDADTEAVVRQHARRVAQAAGRDVQGAVEDRIVSALKEFAFDDLRFELVPAPADATSPPTTTLRVHVAGKGRHVPQELDLDVNFNGFDSVVDLVLATKLGIDRAAARLRQPSDTVSPRNHP